MFLRYLQLIPSYSTLRHSVIVEGKNVFFSEIRSKFHIFDRQYIQKDPHFVCWKFVEIRYFDRLCIQKYLYYLFGVLFLQN